MAVQLTIWRFQKASPASILRRNPFSVKTQNEYGPGYQFDLIGAVICPQSEPCSNPRPFLHKANDPYRSEKNHFNQYLLSFELEPGSYNLSSLATLYQSMWNTAGGYAPLDLKINIAPNTISYLGHIDIVLRERKNESEKKAGRDQINLGPAWSLELTKKSVVGFSTGTFDISVEDKFDEDISLFIQEYPVLQKAKVEKNILPQWTRPENRSAN